MTDAIDRDCKEGGETMLARLIRDESGATAIEYGLIVALIALAAVTAMSGAGNALSNVMTAADEGMQG